MFWARAGVPSGRPLGAGGNLLPPLAFTFPCAHGQGFQRIKGVTWKPQHVCRGWGLLGQACPLETGREADLWLTLYSVRPWVCHCIIAILLLILFKDPQFSLDWESVFPHKITLTSRRPEVLVRPLRRVHRFPLSMTVFSACKAGPEVWKIQAPKYTLMKAGQQQGIPRKIDLLRIKLSSVHQWKEQC